MLDLARRTLAPIADRVELLEGTIDQAPSGPFDGATCILTLHHIERDERLRTRREIRRRPRPGANLIVAVHSAPGPEPDRWMMRYGALGDRDGIDCANSAATRAEERGVGSKCVNRCNTWVWQDKENKT